jgi:hypothetical protein
MGPVKILSTGWMDRRAPVHSEDEEKREEEHATMRIVWDSETGCSLVSKSTYETALHAIACPNNA